MKIEDVKKEIVDFLIRGKEKAYSVQVETEREKNRRVLRKIDLVDGVLMYKDRVFDDSNEMLAYDGNYKDLEDRDIRQHARGIMRYIEDHTR